MRPVVQTWADYGIDYITSSGNYTGGSEILPDVNVVPFPSSSARTNVYSGVNTNYQYVSTTQNNNLIFTVYSFSGADASPSMTFSGEDTYGNVHTETVTITGTGTFHSVEEYATLYYIYWEQTAEMTVSMDIGFQGGSFNWYQCDYYNKQANYTISYSDISVDTGVVSLTPLYKTQQLQLFIDGVQTNNTDTSDAYEIPIANTANVIVSPTTITTIPISANCSISVSNIPMTAITTQMNTATSGTFTQTIIQQGGLV